MFVEAHDEFGIRFIVALSNRWDINFTLKCAHGLEWKVVSMLGNPHWLHI